MDRKHVTGERGYRLWLILGNSLFRRYYRKCASSLGLRGNETVMDFGCGPGLVSYHLAKELPHGLLTCFDISEAAIRLSRKRLGALPNVNFLLGDIRETRLPANSYDIIFLNFVYYHIEKSQRQETMGKLVQLLRDSGHLVIRNAVWKDNGMSGEEIKKDLASLGLREISGETIKSLFLVPTYFGIFEKAASGAERTRATANSRALSGIFVTCSI